MLQSGMRAPMGIKVKGPDLKTIENFGFQLEGILKEVPAVEASAVIADQIVGKPYLEIVPDRQKCARYGITIDAINSLIEVAIGGKVVTTTVEGRERYDVRIRYPRELRGGYEEILEILVTTANGGLIPLGQVAEIQYRPGPQVIKSEDTFLLGYVLFDKKSGFAEVDTVHQAQKLIEQKIKEGTLKVPAGITWAFSGSYENQVRSEKKLRIVLPIALLMIFLILYFNFKRVSTTLLVFSTIVVAWSGGFLMIWLYAQDWFMHFSLLGVNFRELLLIHPINLSVAVWVGFLALFGIASDDGVMIASYLDAVFEKRKPDNKEAIFAATMELIPTPEVAHSFNCIAISAGVWS
jgi:Cu(I)/Ag(I) efflux system membrane protein CusA/SilA